MLDALSAPAGAEDTRSHEQRYHDALEEAMRRLVASNLLPDRAGQPAKVWAHIALADLLDLDADSALQQEWIARVRAQWAGARAAASVAGGDGAAWLDGDAARGFACDASVIPAVMADVNPAALDDLVKLCVELAGHGPGRCGPTSPGQDQTAARQDDTSAREDGAGRRGDGPVPSARRGREALEKAIIGKTTNLLLHLRWVSDLVADLGLRSQHGCRPCRWPSDAAVARCPDQRASLTDSRCRRPHDPRHPRPGRADGRVYRGAVLHTSRRIRLQQAWHGG